MVAVLMDMLEIGWRHFSVCTADAVFSDITSAADPPSDISAGYWPGQSRSSESLYVRVHRDLADVRAASKLPLPQRQRNDNRRTARVLRMDISCSGPRPSSGGTVPAAFVSSAATKAYVIPAPSRLHASCGHPDH